MKNRKNISAFATTCAKCGHELPPGTRYCPGCGMTNPSAQVDSDPWSQWSKAGKTLKTQWVASVIAFWVSAAVLGVGLYIEGKFNLILVSITLGMLLIGIWLKTRYQMHQRREPERQSSDAQSD